MADITRIRLANNVGQGSATVAMARAASAPNVSHATVLVGLLLAMSLAVAITLLEDSPLGALEFLLVTPIVAGILSVAWMRPPSGSPEHHPAIDRILDDTSP